jgi:hypothetical protein
VALTNVPTVPPATSQSLRYAHAGGGGDDGDGDDGAGVGEDDVAMYSHRNCTFRSEARYGLATAALAAALPAGR